MSSSTSPRGLRWAVLVALLGLASHVAIAQSARTTPKFYPDDPLATDNDHVARRIGIRRSRAVGGVGLPDQHLYVAGREARRPRREREHAGRSARFELVHESHRRPRPAARRDCPRPEQVRQPRRRQGLDAGARQESRRLPARLPRVARRRSRAGLSARGRPAEASADGQRRRIHRDADLSRPRVSRRRRLHHQGRPGAALDLRRRDHSRCVGRAQVQPRRISEAILSVAGRDANGLVTMSATRIEEGSNRGRFEYYGTRSDDPNDIYPHEHRRELRGNRVFSAWLAHDDSRAVNTRNILMRSTAAGVVQPLHVRLRRDARERDALCRARRQQPRVLPRRRFAGAEVARRRWGLAVPKYLRNRPSNLPPAIGAFDSTSFDPVLWRPNYPNPAFGNMRPGRCVLGGAAGVAVLERGDSRHRRRREV